MLDRHNLSRLELGFRSVESDDDGDDAEVVEPEATQTKEILDSPPPYLEVAEALIGWRIGRVVWH